MADAVLPESDGASAPPVEHVLHVVDEDVCTRFAPMFTQVMQSLCASGVRTSLLTDDEDVVARLERSPVECHWVPQLSGWRAWGLGRYLSAHFSTPPDIVHLWGTAGLGWVERWAVHAGVPLLVYLLGQSHVEGVMRGGVEHKHLATASPALGDPLTARFPHAAPRCRTIRPAIARPMHPPRPRDAERTFSILCATPLTADAGLSVLIDAVAQLHRNHCEVQVGLVGDGPAVSEVWRQIRDRDVRDCVSLVDDPKLWEKVLPEVDACVVPACQRELSIVPLLAMAFGKVVIAARDQVADWFIADRTTWEFTPGSAVELAYLLGRAIEQPRLARELGDSAAAYVHAQRSIRDLLAELLDTYAAMTGSASTAAETREPVRE